MTRIGVFVYGEALSPYGRLLSSWSKSREDVSLFSDKTDVLDCHHYLRFYQFNAESPFDVLIYDVDDTAAHAAAFPIILKHPGILFCNDIELVQFAHAVSHESSDPWGTGWIFNNAAANKAGDLVELSEHDVVHGNKSSLAVAMAKRSVGVVVPDTECEMRIAEDTRLPKLKVIDQNISDVDFAACIEEYLPAWITSTKHSIDSLGPICHPFHDLYAIEQERVRERFAGKSKDLLDRALETLREMFDGATYSATAGRGEH